MNVRSHFAKAMHLLFVLALVLPLAGVQPTQPVRADDNSTVSLVVAADTHMRSGSTRGGYNYGGSPTIRLNPYYEQGSTDGQLTGILLKWDLSSAGIPAGAQVTAASLTFHVTDGSNYAYGLYNMRRAWVEGNKDGATGSGASWNYYGAGTGSWGTAGAQNTSSDRYDTNLWNATAAQFNATGSVIFDLNADGLAVIQGWLDGTLTNNGLTIQDYSGSRTDLWQAASKEATDPAQRPGLNITYRLASTDPTIHTSGTLSAFSTQPGVPSDPQTYTVSGSNLEGAIEITAPSGFQLSTDGSDYYSSLTLTPSGGSASAAIYVRLYSDAEGDFSGDIVHTSAGAATVKVAVSGIARTAPTCVESRVSASADDAEERNDTGAVDLDGDSSAHALQTFRKYGGSSTGTLNWWGLRFPNVNVPQGATITSATVTFRANASSGTATAGMALWGQLAANPSTFTTTDKNITSRAQTAASVSWSMPQWTSDSDYQTPDLAAIVQEIVNQPEWAANNALVIVGQATVSENRSAVSRDSSNGSTLAPLLIVCYTLAPTGPTIDTSGTLSPFTSAVGEYSAEQSYTVSGSNLTEAITIAAPSGFEVSTTSGSGFATSLTLPHTGGTVAPSTIHVRFRRTTAGTSSGDITHTSAGATQRNVSVSGTATAPLTSWIAYNDCAWASGQLEKNITKYTIPGSGNTSTGRLVDYATGEETQVTVAIAAGGSPGVQTDPEYGGAETNAGTDAYDTFHGIADMAGVIYYGSSSGWYVDLTFSGLDPAATYTFATSANRNGSTYTRNSRFTISGVEAATNASTQGVTVKSETAVAFNTGYNTVNGYVARWTGISPGADGAFTVRVEADSSNEAYGPSVFMLGLEGEAVTYTFSTSTDGNGTVTLSPPGGIYLAGSTVTLTPVPDAGFAFSHWGGPNAADLIDNGDGTWAIVMDGDKSVEAHFEVSLCTQVSLVASADTWMRKSQPKQNWGGSQTVQVSPLADYPQNSLYRWDLSSIPARATVSAASLSFHVTDSSAYEFYLYNMRRAWVEGTSSGTDSTTSANWNTYDGVNSWGAGGAESTSTDRFDTNLWNVTTSTFGITGSQTIPLNASGVAVVQGWVDGSLSNHGLTMQKHTTSSSGDYWIVASREATDEGQRPRLNVTYCLPSTGPKIVTSGTLNPFTAAVGQYSAEQSYTVSGSNLTGDITITAPADFQISTTPGSGFGSSISLTPADGSVPETAIHVRFQRTTAGTSTGDITHTSAEATQRNLAVSGTAVSGPPAVSLVRPADGAAGISLPPTLEVTATDPEADTMTVSFYGRPVGGGGGSGEEFTLAVIPDTQMAAQSYPTMMANQFQWISDQYTAGAAASIAKNTVFVTGVGDIVNTSSSTTQWQAADAAYDKLDDAAVPYSVSPGNHDVAFGPTSYNDYFGPSRFQGKAYYQGPMTAGKNENNYSFFGASGMDFIVVNLTYQPDQTARDWADSLLKANPGRRGIVVQHDILNVDNTFVNQTSYNELRDNPNLFLMLCGHMHTYNDGSAYYAGTGSTAPGQTIHILQTDYQELSGGNNDYLRLLRFSPAEDRIYASVYSPHVPGGYRTNDPTEQFTMDYDMVAGSGAFELIGTVTGVASGANASVEWPELEEGVEYEWYVEASDGTSTTTSDTWSFTAGELVLPEHVISVYRGWNLVSFNLHPIDTAIEAVLGGISGQYDLVYAWDAPSGQWRRYDPEAAYGNTLTALDETLGFWIHMLEATTLTVTGQAPEASSIEVCAGWNLLGYPSAVDRALPGALTANQVQDLATVLAFRANDGADPWKLYDVAVVDAAPYANDLAEMRPGWGYWIQVGVQSVWALPYQP